MQYYLYKITNLINEKIYIGVHETEHIDDGYMGSGKLVIYAIKKYGKDNFKKEILEFFNTREEMYIKESSVVTSDFCLNKNTYNIVQGGSGGSIKMNRKPFTGSHTEETKQKLAIISKGRLHTVETKKKMSKNSWAKRNPKRQKEHAIKAASGLKSEEHKKKISDSLKGRTGNLSPNYGIKREKIECPHCDKEGAKNVMLRWHFNNCRQIFIEV